MASGDGIAVVGEKRRHRDEDLDSEFDFGAEASKRTWRDDPLISSKPKHFKNSSCHSAALPSKDLLVSERDKEEWKARKFHYLAMDAYSRHKALVNQYLLSCGKGIEHFKRSTEKDRNDYSVLAEEHKFLWEPQDETQTWEKKLAKTYYDKLFKEYAIADLSRYKENKVAMRWRVEKEVCEGKGQFSCGNKHCSKNEGLISWEVNFSYCEQSEQKNALVKLRLCPKCSKKLNYHKKCKVWKGSKKKKHKKTDDNERNELRVERREMSPVGRDLEKRRYSDGSDREESKDQRVEASISVGKTSGTSDSGIWSKPVENFLEKSMTEEFNEYFKDMLL